jgi:RNA polymerase sigma-70 factor (ECF subfamily)
MADSDTKKRLAAWFSQWRAPLRKFLVAKGAVPAADLDDVAQEVFLRLMRYEKAELVEHPQAYLYKMASNVAAEWAIRSRNRHPHQAKWLESLTTDSRPEEEIVRAEEQSQLLRSIAGLSARQREILQLYFVEGLTLSEAAERLGLSQRIVKRQLVKSYAKLRDQMAVESIERIPHGRE